MIVWDGIALVALAVWGVALIGSLLFYCGLKIYGYFCHHCKKSKRKK